jgi:tripartite-type tricarboxylate transporter receptor subunit TctC
MKFCVRGFASAGLTRRAMVLGSAALAAASLSVTSPASAATDWPTKTVTIVVPFPAGGNTDTMARLLAENLSKKLGQTFIVDNRPAAGGTLATGQVAKAKPDGYTLMFGSAGQLIILPMLQKVSYDSTKDLAPLSIFGTGPFILGVKTSIPANSLLQYSTGGRLKLLAVSLPEPLKQLPDVPAVASIFPGFKTSSWNGLIGPVGMPKDLADKIVQVTIEASKDPTIIERLTTLGIAPTGSTAEEFATIVAEERTLYREAVDAAGLKMEQ